MNINQLKSLNRLYSLLNKAQNKSIDALSLIDRPRQHQLKDKMIRQNKRYEEKRHE